LLHFSLPKKAKKKKKKERKTMLNESTKITTDELLQIYQEERTNSLDLEERP
jgi:hypothetical protein